MNIDTSLPFPKNIKYNALMKLIKKCTAFLSASDEIQLRQKIIDLNGLYTIWNSDTDEGELFSLLVYFNCPYLLLVLNVYF